MIKIKNQKTKKKHYEFIFLVLLCFTTTVYPQKLKWKTENGWALRETSQGSEKYEKYFSLGVWGIPNYYYSVNNTTKEDPEVFQREKSHFNSYIIQSGFDSYDYFDNVTLFAGINSIFWEFRPPKDTTDFMFKYTHMQNTLLLQDYMIKNKINNAINGVFDINKNRDFIWSTIDEPADGSDGWSWTPKITEIIYQSIKTKTSDNLVFLNLTGSLRGNIHFFDKMHSIESTPDPLVFRDASLSNCPNKVEFFKCKFDSTPRFYCKGDTICERPDSKQISNYYYNTFNLAKDYKSSCDIIGVDAYDEFYTDPKTVGLAISALKAGAGNKPVWIYFDGNGYFRNGEKTPTVVKNIKCQIYTAIINGATGVLFWNDLKKGSEVYNETKMLADTLKMYDDIIKADDVLTNLDTDISQWEDNYNLDIQYVIKQKSNGRQYIIAVNRSSSIRTLEVSGFPVKSLQPFEVFISPSVPKNKQIVSLFSSGKNFVDVDNMKVVNPRFSSFIDSQSKDFQIDRIRFVVPGDYNGDGISDLAIFYDKSDLAQNIVILLSDGKDFRTQSGVIVTDINNGDNWISQSRTEFNLSNVRFATSGDYNGDGTSDLVIFIFYDQNDLAQNIVVLLSNKKEFKDQWGNEVADVKKGDWWISQSRTEFNLSNVRFATSGDYNGDVQYLATSIKILRVIYSYFITNQPQAVVI